MLQGVQKACGHAAWLAYLRPKEKKPEEVLQGRCRVEGGKQATMPKQAGRALLPQGGFYLDSVGYGMVGSFTWSQALLQVVYDRQRDHFGC